MTAPSFQTRYWINTISRDHVMIGEAGGFTQPGHGKNSGLKRLTRGDFTPSSEAPIRPLIENFDFIIDKKQWGYPFRRGLFAIERADFERIAEAMGLREETLR